MKVKKGDVVYMSKDSGCIGYGNPQCVSSVCEPLGEIGLYGHNQHYKIYDIKEIVPQVSDTPPSQSEGDGSDAIAFNKWMRSSPYKSYDDESDLRIYKIYKSQTIQI